MAKITVKSSSNNSISNSANSGQNANKNNSNVFQRNMVTEIKGIKTILANNNKILEGFKKIADNLSKNSFMNQGKTDPNAKSDLRGASEAAEDAEKSAPLVNAIKSLGKGISSFFGSKKDSEKVKSGSSSGSSLLGKIFKGAMIVGLVANLIKHYGGKLGFMLLGLVALAPKLMMKMAWWLIKKATGLLGKLLWKGLKWVGPKLWNGLKGIFNWGKKALGNLFNKGAKKAATKAVAKGAAKTAAKSAAKNVAKKTALKSVTKLGGKLLKGGAAGLGLGLAGEAVHEWGAQGLQKLGVGEKTATNVANYAGSALKGAAYGAVLGPVGAAIGAGVGILAQGAKDLWDKYGSRIKKGVKNLGKKALSAAKNALSFGKKALKGAGKAILGLGKKAWSGLKSIGSKLSGWFSKGNKAAKEAGKKMLNGVKNFGKKLGGWLKKGAKSIANLKKKALDGVKSIGKKALSWLGFGGKDKSKDGTLKSSNLTSPKLDSNLNNDLNTSSGNLAAASMDAKEKQQLNSQYNRIQDFATQTANAELELLRQIAYSLDPSGKYRLNGGYTPQSIPNGSNGQTADMSRPQ